MAERRMFSKSIIDSDVFLDMPPTTQLLYFHLAMRADDDGFINNPKKIQRMLGCSDDDLRLLIFKKLIIPFESGVVVVTHWKMHNYIQRDRYKETVYKEEKSTLTVENGIYVSTLDTNCIQTVSEMDTQVRLGKVSIGKDSIELFDETENVSNISEKKEEKNKKENDKPKKEKPIRHQYGEYKNVLLSDDELKKLKVEFPDDYQDRIEKLSEYIASTGKKYSNFLATIRNWAKREQGHNKNNKLIQQAEQMDTKIETPTKKPTAEEIQEKEKYDKLIKQMLKDMQEGQNERLKQ